MKHNLYSKCSSSVTKALRAVGTRSFTKGIAVITLLSFLNWNLQSAAPPAGAPIGNQASATYTDASNAPRTATSNPVTTIVQQVYGIALTADGSKTVAVGSQVVFPHSLKNTGNGNDTYNLTTNNIGGSFNFTGMAIYADANGDGIPDNAVKISVTPSLAAGESFQFVLVGTVPGTAVSGDIATMSVTGTSVGDGAQTASNTDTVTVTDNAAIDITKSISTSSGFSPSGPYTYTLVYQNNGNNTATNLVIIDNIPAGMTYVSNSARASITGATALTDALSTDSQGTAPNTIIYDFAATVTGRITAKIANVAPGQSGNLTFQVTVNSNVPPSTIVNQASFTYYDGAGNSATFFSNPSQFEVLQSAGVTLGDHTIANATQGSTITFTNLLTNAGNGEDSFDLTVDSSTFPSGSTITFYNSGGAPMTDSGGSTDPDTGPIAAGGTYNVLVRVTLPPDATNAPYTLVKRATSRFNNAVSDPGTDTLSTITPNSVDLVNNAPAGPGAGAGPEVSAVTTLSSLPGGTTRFTLYVKNLSSVADSFDLSASTNSTFATVGLPTGWSITFKDGSEAVIASTGVILSNANKLVYADVTIPANAGPGTNHIYFRVKSPTTLISDIKHDALVVTAVRALQLTPNNSGQVFPGGSVVYSHILLNQGNVSEGGALSTVSFALVNSQAGAGFSSVLYLDQNNDGVLSTNDPVITGLGTNVLAPGASLRVFVKVFAPSGANAGSIDVATITASTVNGSNSGTPPASVFATDTSTVISGDLTIDKDQALDANGNGILDGAEAYSTGDIVAGAYPGASILYRLRVTNTGTATATSVVVTDTTPTYTTYSTHGGAANTSPAAHTTVGTISAPANGAAGAITATIGSMTPGQIVTITFGVIINQ